MSVATKTIFSAFEQCPPVTDALANVKRHAGEIATHCTSSNAFQHRHVAIALAVYGNESAIAILTPDEKRWATDMGKKIADQFSNYAQIPKPMARIINEAKRQGLI